MTPMITIAMTILTVLVDRTRLAWRGRGGEAGASTLELVILILGLITVATILVAAITAAVKSRTDQIN